MTHNENNKNFSDIACHVELKYEYLETAKLNAHAYMAKSSSKKAPSFKHKWENNKRER